MRNDENTQTNSCTLNKEIADCFEKLTDEELLVCLVTLQQYIKTGQLWICLLEMTGTQLCQLMPIHIRIIQQPVL